MSIIEATLKNFAINFDLVADSKYVHVFYNNSLVDKNKKECRLCGNEVTYNTPDKNSPEKSHYSLKTMKEHLINFHKIRAENVNSIAESFFSNTEVLTQTNLSQFGFDTLQPAASAKLAQIAKFFATNGLARNAFTKQNFWDIVDKDPEKTTVKLDIAITQLAADSIEQVRRICEKTSCSVEIDGWDSHKRTFFNILSNGAISNVVEFTNKTESKENMIELCFQTLESLEKDFNIVPTSICTDNTNKIFPAARETGQKFGVLSTHCVGHSLNLKIKELFEKSSLMRRLLTKIHIIGKIFRRKKCSGLRKDTEGKISNEISVEVAIDWCKQMTEQNGGLDKVRSFD